MLPSLVAFVDWISLSTTVDSVHTLESLLVYVQNRFLIEFDHVNPSVSDDFSGRWSRYVGGFGASYSTKHVGSDGEISVRLVFPGSLLSSVYDWSLHATMKYMSDRWGCKCTRIDLAVDDSHKQLDYQDIIDATKNGNAVGFQEGKVIESYNGSNPGKTVYCGARRSAKYARFYNKGDVDRFEIEFKLDLGQSIFLDWVALDEQVANDFLCSVLREAISFVDKKDKNLARNEVLPWWESFRVRISSQGIVVPRKKRVCSIERTVAWIERSVSKAVLKCRAAMGVEQFSQVLEVAVILSKQRVTEIDNMHVREYQSQYASC